MLKRRVKQRRRIGRVWTRALQFCLGSQCQDPIGKDWKREMGLKGRREKTTNASVATLFCPSPIAFTMPVKIPAIRILPGP